MTRKCRWLFSLPVSLTYINLWGLAAATKRSSGKNYKSKSWNVYRQACSVIHLMLPLPSTEFCECKSIYCDIESNIHQLLFCPFYENGQRSCENLDVETVARKFNVKKLSGRFPKIKKKARAIESDFSKVAGLAD